MPARNRILDKMLDRLFASMVNGPSLNARPHASRQRIDLTQLSRLGDTSGDEVLRGLLSSGASAKLKSKLTPPRNGGDDVDESQLTDEQRSERRKFKEQQSLLQKLRVIAEGAKTYEQDTGVHVLNVGFPLLSLPPGSFAMARAGGSATRRILAPVAFIPVSVTVKRGAMTIIELACKGEGTDRIVPNAALLAWIEQQTGRESKELFADDEGTDPLREICQAVEHVCTSLEMPVPEEFMVLPNLPPGEEEESAEQEAASSKPNEIAIARPTETGDDSLDSTLPPAISQGQEEEARGNVEAGNEGLDSTFTREDARGDVESRDEEIESSLTPLLSRAETEDDPPFRLISAPRSDETDSSPTLLCSAVLGLYPMSNQGLLRDMKAMAGGEVSLAGPVESFVQAGVELDVMPAPEEKADGALDGVKKPKVFTDERLITAADPCQSRAVKLARECRGLVIHGPPGTGKSQTIANIIGDHLSRGMRVLFVCDKRTALDVVANRLQHMGLGWLCAVVHDPQRDQRDLYRNVRQQLDDLPDVTTSDPKAEKRLARLDEELQSLHAELTQTHEALMQDEPATGLSFHELIGKWLAASFASDDEIGTPGVTLDDALLSSAGIWEFESNEHALRTLFDRAVNVVYASNPWRLAAGIPVDDFISRPMEPFRAAMRTSVEAAHAADATADPDVPPFNPDCDLMATGDARATLADRLEDVLRRVDPAILASWSDKRAEVVERARKTLADNKPILEAARREPLDASLAMVIRSSPPPPAQINAQLAALSAYIDASKSFLGFLAFGKKSAAAQVLNSFGLTVSRENAERVRAFFEALRSRILLHEIVHGLTNLNGGSPPADDERSFDLFDQLHRLVELLHEVNQSPLVNDLAPSVNAVLSHPVAADSLIRGLRKSPQRAQTIADLESSLVKTLLFDQKWRCSASMQVRSGKTASEAIEALNERLDTLEGVLRTRQGLTALPPALLAAAESLIMQSAESEPAVAAMRRSVYAGEIARRLKNDPNLRNIDGQRMTSSFERYRVLDEQKRQLVRDSILHQWTTRQKDKLLAGTGSRLNSTGADLRRRLTMRGERAMRLRQVIHVGQSIEGGDPLFDVCPVWMASPETVAQVFPREPFFDVLIFDEASQCRLEEALPVLLRGRRVVIAGDPKQLPPTRFFESTVAQSDDEAIETEQQLFEVQQGEIEDLLAAALNLSIEQCYLDVHYRSRNADLIAFSNEQFYGSRLQAIPGHPKNRAKFPPLTLYHAGGTYKSGENEIEAQHVCNIVRDLLKRGDPPSIGIACMNINQRDLILEKLDELAASDTSFGRKLAAARTRSGEGSFEGLFVKNLENVQGDERDHIIISTTYGPDERGRFYKRFGPLGRAGGGRRMNVLVTRARHEVHLVTSIPPEVYRALPPIPPGQQAGGGWLLFAYLHFAEQLRAAYELPLAAREGQEEGVSDSDTASDSRDETVGSTLTLAPSDGEREPDVTVRSSRFPSICAEALARQIATQAGTRAEVHWGNDGFCVDIALHHPTRPDDVTLGVIVDSSRFAQAQDPVEWDVFRTAIHESQGWTLQRLWTPHFFRDPLGTLTSIQRESQRIVESMPDTDQDALRVKPT